MDVALYARADGLYEPRHPKAIEICKSNAGRMVIADIKVDIRTALQNKYLNGWIYTQQICTKLNDAGIPNPIGAIWTRNNVHAVMQESFLILEEFLLNGKHVKVYQSTADMSRKRFTKYINDEIRPLCSSWWGIEIDDPKEGFYKSVRDEIYKDYPEAQQ